MAEMEITRNERVMAADGTEVGRVIHVIVDGTSRQVTDLVVERDGNEMLVPIGSVTRGAGHTLMLASAAPAMSGMAFDRAGYHAVDEEEVDAMPERPAAGGATLEHVSGNSATVTEPTGAVRETAVPERTTPRATEQATPRAPRTTDRATTRRDAARDDEDVTVPVVEERLTADVREREAGRFRLVKDVRTEQQSIDVPVRHEEVYITETPVRRPATEADLAALDRDIEVPIRDQEAIVAKEARVTGEVEIRKETDTQTQRVSDTVRRETVHVEAPDDSRVHVEGNLTDDQRARYGRMSATDQQRYARFTDAERTQYDAMTPEQQRAFATDYDRRNPVQKAADKLTGRD